MMLLILGMQFELGENITKQSKTVQKQVKSSKLKKKLTKYGGDARFCFFAEDGRYAFGCISFFLILGLSIGVRFFGMMFLLCENDVALQILPSQKGSEAARGYKKTTECCFSPSVPEPQ